MPAIIFKISTTVRNSIPLFALRLSYLIGSWLAPETTIHRAARLFTTPFKSTRSRALAAPTLGAHEETLDVDGVAIET